MAHFDVIEKLGAGGMGEVFRARDTELNRDVALKVLSPHFAEDPERIARLRREAQILASLNHPGIASIYGMEDAALVMEYVPGNSPRGPMPADKALALAKQLADAIEYAHERGIVHRDLKPENIKVTPDGQLKVLDFGLAKAVETTVPSEVTASHLSIPGAILGTPAYMSPEQARGLPTDKRTDIWAFGCVLYEWLSGRRAFPGETATDAMAAVINADPDWSALPAGSPVTLLERCLQKDARIRLRDIGDARFEATSPPAAVRTSRDWWLALALIVAVAAIWMLRPKPEPAASDVQFQRLTDMVGMEESPALSPDGKTVAFVARVNGKRQLWIRLLAGGAPLQITHDDVEHEEPRWAPDSDALVYHSPGAIWEVAALGGAPRRLADSISGGDVSHDGQRVAMFQSRDGHPMLVIVSRNGSGTSTLSAIPMPSGRLIDFPYDHPRWSLDDKWIAFHRGAGELFDESLYIVASGGGVPALVRSGDTVRGFSWLPDGSGLLFASAGGSTILYPPVLNLRTIRRDGSRERQLTFGDVSYVDPDVQRNGRIVTARIRSQSDIWKFPVSGTPEQNVRDAVRITHQTGQVRTPSLSGDGKEIVYLSDSGGHGNLWVISAEGSGTRQITFERDPDIVLGVPAWSPAGSQIVYIRTRLGDTALWMVNSDGSAAHLLVKGSGAMWSNDGKWVYYTASLNGQVCISKIPASGGAPVQVQCPSGNSVGLSPDNSTFYFLAQIKSLDGGWDNEVHSASPENGASRTLSGRILKARVPVDPGLLQMFLSPDGRRIAAALVDNSTGNLWTMPASGGDFQPLTDFGTRSILIARRVAWTPDSKFIYAAVEERDSDIVLLDGLLPRR